MKTKKILFAIMMVSAFAFATFAATSVEINNDDDKRVAVDKRKLKPKTHG